MDNEMRPVQTPGILDELLKVQKKQSAIMRVVMIVNVLLLAALLVTAVLLLPRMQRMMTSTEKSLEQVEELTTQAKQSLAGIDEMVAGANTVLTENAQGMNEALQHFNDVDFEALNQAIKDLSDTVAPMAEFVRMFN